MKSFIVFGLLALMPLVLASNTLPVDVDFGEDFIKFNIKNIDEKNIDNYASIARNFVKLNLLGGLQNEDIDEYVEYAYELLYLSSDFGYFIPSFDEFRRITIC